MMSWVLSLCVKFYFLSYRLQRQQINANGLHLQPLLLSNFITLLQNPTIHHLTTMLATSKNILFPRPNHLQATDANDLTL